MGLPKYVKSIVKVDDLTVKFVLSEPNAPIIANLAMDFASIVSKEYADKLAAAGTPQLFSTRSRSAPAPSSSSTTSLTRSSATRRFLTIGAASDRSTT